MMDKFVEVKIDNELVRWGITGISEQEFINDFENMFDSMTPITREEFIKHENQKKSITIKKENRDYYMAIYIAQYESEESKQEWDESYRKSKSIIRQRKTFKEK